MKNTNTFFIDMLGCEKRKLDAERIIAYMKANGYSQISTEKEINNADVAIFVSCAFNSEYSEKSKKRVLSIQKQKGGSTKFILSGCLPEIEPDFLTMNLITDFCGPRDMEKLEKILPMQKRMEEVPNQNTSYFDNRKYSIPDAEFRSLILEEYVNSKNCYKIRVNWGCMSRCSYCAVKNATKNLKSKQLILIKDEMEKGIQEGHTKFFITGGDVGAYGLDIGTNVIELLDLLTSFNDIDLYIQEFNAQWLIKYTDGIKKVLSSNLSNYNKLFLNVPIQSGSDLILKKMRRPYKSDQILKTLKKLHEDNHKIRLGSHFIVGFPGESEREFGKTLDFIRRGYLDFIMVFSYSDNPNIDSFKFKPKVKNEIAVNRRTRLLKLQRDLDFKQNRYLNIKNLDIEEISRLGEGIEGWLVPKEGKFLFNLAKELKFGNIVEIGSWKGKSTFFLAAGLIHRGWGKLYSVDLHSGSKEQRERSSEPLDTFPEFVANMKKYNVGHLIMSYVVDSVTASKEINDEIGLVFVDGSHEYSDVKSDFEAWWPKLKSGGIIAFHDTYTWPSIPKLIRKLLNERDDIKNPTLVQEITYFEKAESNPSRNRIYHSIFIEQMETAFEKCYDRKGSV